MNRLREMTNFKAQMSNEFQSPNFKMRKEEKISPPKWLLKKFKGFDF
jgi:hypothetical protein